MQAHDARFRSPGGTSRHLGPTPESIGGLDREESKACDGRELNPVSADARPLSRSRRRLWLGSRSTRLGLIRRTGRA
jgi:hypothetical protein